MMTGMADGEHRTGSYESGADYFLPKGFEPSELRALIDRVMQRQQPLQFAAPLMQALDGRADLADMPEIADAIKLLGEVQRDMLPQGERAVPGLSAGACLVPSLIASGDFYDFLPWNDKGELAFVVGDVSGHGLAAAYFMVMVRTALRVLCRQHRRLSDAVAALNDILLQETPAGWFVTLFYGVANPRAAELRYVSAGHCPAVLSEAQGGTRLLEPTGPALGIVPEQAYPEATVALAPAARLACTTDGVIDAVRTQDLDARYEWVRRVVGESDGRSALEVAQALVHGAAADAVGGHRDDLAALVLQRS